MAPRAERDGFLVEFRPMSPEEIERTVQFLLAHQAEVAADFSRLSDKTDRIADALLGLTGIVGRLADAQDRTDAQLRETDAHLRQTDEQLRLTGEHINTVESHLQVLIDTFERQLRRPRPATVVTRPAVRVHRRLHSLNHLP